MYFKETKPWRNTFLQHLEIELIHHLPLLQPLVPTPTNHPHIILHGLMFGPIWICLYLYLFITDYIETIFILGSGVLFCFFVRRQMETLYSKQSTLVKTWPTLSINKNFLRTSIGILVYLHLPSPALRNGFQEIWILGLILFYLT